MNSLIAFFIIFISGEVISFFIFKIMNFLLLKSWEFRLNLSVVKGTIERLFLFLSLVHNLPHALIAFGAIKIGTRIRPDKKISNDYFFIGNMVSLTISVVYSTLWRIATR